MHMAKDDHYLLDNLSVRRKEQEKTSCQLYKKVRYSSVRGLFVFAVMSVLFFLFFVLLLVGLTMRLSFCSLSYSFPAFVGLNDDAIFYSLSLSFPFFSLTFSFLPSGILLPHTSENYLGERESMLQLA